MFASPGNISTFITFFLVCSKYSFPSLVLVTCRFSFYHICRVSIIFLFYHSHLIYLVFPLVFFLVVLLIILSEGYLHILPFPVSTFLIFFTKVRLVVSLDPFSFFLAFTQYVLNKCCQGLCGFALVSSYVFF